jgi:hypothetical protein
MAKTACFGKIGNWKESLARIEKSKSEGAKSLFFYEWAERPVQFSEGFYAEEYPESEKFSDGHFVIQDIMRQIDSMFVGEFSMLNREYLEDKGFRAYLLDRFKDPGLLHHCVFWDFGNDPTAITFEWLHFHGKGHLCLDMLHGENYDIFGRPCTASSDDSPWNQLITLYHDQIERHQENEPGWKLFATVVGWPLS